MFQKGQSGYPQGREKGGSNKDTIAIKKAYLDLLNNNLRNIQVWLNRVAAEDPGRAIDLLLKMTPFVVPKKTEADITIDNPINIIIPPDNS